MKLFYYEASFVSCNNYARTISDALLRLIIYQNVLVSRRRPYKHSAMKRKL